MDKGRKAWRKLESLKGLHDERERREKGEHKLERETELKLKCKLSLVLSLCFSFYTAYMVGFKLIMN